MTSPVNVDVKPGINKFNVDKEHPRTVAKADADKQALELLVEACLAGLHKKQNGGNVYFDYAGCLECSACYILGLGSALEQREYPHDVSGVEFRYGRYWFDAQCRTDFHYKRTGTTHATAQKLW